ncbi:MAG: DUF2971 domain-containing protein [Bosea sp. (in: a-proteobacteria)]
MNDPTDCSPFLYVDLDSDKIKNYIRKLVDLRVSHDGYTSHLARQIVELMDNPAEAVGAAEVKSNTKRRARVFLEGEFYTEYTDDLGKIFIRTYMNSLVDDARIFSMARLWEEPKLWAHYADSHSGFCIEMSGLDKLPEAIFSGRVDYTSRRPRLSTSDLESVQGEGSNEHKEDILSRLYLQKSIGWDYEKEFRLVMAKSDFNRISPSLRLPEGDYIKFDKIKIEKIILGINSSYGNRRMMQQFIDDFCEGKNKPSLMMVSQNEDDYEISLREMFPYELDEDIPF